MKRTQKPLTPEQKRFYEGFNVQSVSVKPHVSNNVMVTSGFRKGQCGKVVGEETTIIGKMLRIDFGEKGEGLISRDELRFL